MGARWKGPRGRWLVLLVVLGMLMAACSGTSTDTTTAGGDGPTDTSAAPPDEPGDTQAPSDGDTSDKAITIAIGSEPSTLDPQIRDDGGERAITDNVYETLLSRDPEGELIPLLATDLPTQLDDTTWELEIREGVSFHNGNPLDAAAVVASFERFLELGEESEQVGFFETIASVEATGDMTVQFTTTAPDPVFPARLYALRVIDATTVDQGIESEPVGTGPYRFVTWQRGSTIELEANSDYWGGAPAIGRITYRFIEESGTRLAGLVSGELDLITNLSPEDAAGAPVAAGVLGLEHPIFILNAIDGPTADVRVRQAMNYAIDKEALAQSLFGGRAQVDACQILSPSVFGFNPNLEPYPYDPDMARSLISEAGAEGAAIQVVGESGRWLKDRELIEALANFWSEVGLAPEVQIYEFGEYLNRLFDRETRAPAIFVSSSNDLLDPTRQLGNYYHMDGIGSSNVDEELAGWIAEGASETDLDAREALYHQATERACSEAYFAFLLNIEDTYGMSERLVWNPRVDGKLMVKEMDVSS